jgi:hypothetical protein
LARAKQIYPEKTLQVAAVSWLRAQWGYNEVFADAEAVGERVDSVGRLKGRLVMIEVKPAVHANMVDHAPDRHGSLESKIAGALGPLHRRADDRLSQLANSCWDRKQPPVIVVLAGSFSADGLSRLEAMLARCSGAWAFD